MKTCKISVLMPESDAHRFEAYCRELGFKKSTLIVRLIKEHLDQNTSEREARAHELVAERHH